MSPIPLAPRFAAGLLAALPIGAQDWSGFRGSNCSAVSDAQDLPTSFGPEESLRWKTEIPFGRSSPILTESAVVVTGSDEENLYVMAIDRTSGEERWTQALKRARTEEIHSDNDSAAPTPVTDGQNVYAFFPELGLVSFDAEGDERWRHSLGPFVSYYGMSSSPVLAGDTLVQLCDQQVGSYILAVDAATGEERWKVERTGIVECFTTPVVYPADAPEQVIISGSFYVTSYSLDSGQELWRMKGFAYSPMPSPTLSGDTLFVCSPHPPEFSMPEFEALLASHDGNADGKLNKDELQGSHLHFGWLDANKDGVLLREEYVFAREGMASKGYGMVAIHLSRDEGPTELWRYKKGLPQISSPLLYDGVLYLTRDGGLVTTLDAETGGVLQRERLPHGMSECYPSPVAAGGKVYVTSNAGRIAVLEAGPGWNVLGSNELAEECFATPAIGEDSLYVRTSKALYAFGDR